MPEAAVSNHDAAAGAPVGREDAAEALFAALDAGAAEGASRCTLLDMPWLRRLAVLFAFHGCVRAVVANSAVIQRLMGDHNAL